MPLAFPSWEGLGVGSSCLLPLAYYLLPAPCSLLPQKMHLTKLKKTILIKH
ncbi:MAG: hypothetical protein F6K50_32180 [Moorea sp. SIO3I7]|uniref:hypothetical protein n=1 Tax=Moorena sp. SIO3I8 TaxID=2607833 RepID=UPI0013C237C3|nr:hypothetical protein [Moorena sp. SIO3I8]NEN99963.1 hypothetical protein [Moorena sp. SIO3I7]NEO04720.1 hypothetical protein [Moorena sp. SIO3I8]